MNSSNDMISSNTSSDMLDIICSGLSINREEVRSLIEKYGVEEAARVVGYNLSSYDYSIAAGRMLVYHVHQSRPNTVREWMDTLRYKLKSDIIYFITANIEALEDALLKTYHLEFNTDWFAANTMTTMYSAKVTVKIMREVEIGGVEETSMLDSISDSLDNIESNIDEETSGITQVKTRWIEDTELKSVETPQLTWLRCAIGLHYKDSIGSVLESYNDYVNAYITPATPTILNASFKKSQMSSCFIKGTMVTTLNGPIPIEDVVIGDEVITHNGHIKKVVQIHINTVDDRELFALKVHGSPTIIVTGNHPLYCIIGDSLPSFVPVDQLTECHYISIPSRVEDSDNVECNTIVEYNGMNFKMTFNEKSVYAIGMWYVADRSSVSSSISSSSLSSSVSSTPIESQCNRDIETDDTDDIAISICVSSIDSDEDVKSIYLRGLRELVDYDVPVMPAYAVSFFKNKTRCNKMMYKWHPSLIRSFFLGICGSNNGMVTLESDGQDDLSTDLYHLARIGGIPIERVEDSLRINCNYITSTQNIVTDQDVSPIKKINGVTYMRVIACINISSRSNDSMSSMEVYTLGIEDDHSYSVEGIIAQNCFVITIPDNLNRMLKVGVQEAGMISKSNGGLGMDIHNVRHSRISDTGRSDGVIPYIQLINSMIRQCRQGSRDGAVTLYIRPYHIDVFDFIGVTAKVGERYTVAHNINTALWCPWFFFDRVNNDENFTLFCPSVSTSLEEKYGVELYKEYMRLESDITIKDKMIVRARDIFEKICMMQKEAGMPYLMNMDACNLKSNHRHMGVIKCSNLCTEIIEYTEDRVEEDVDPDDDTSTIASCNLHSINLKAFALKKCESIDDITEAYDFDHLGLITRRGICNLNKVIDNNWYPLDKHDIDQKVVRQRKINRSNNRDRPVGLGVAGFAYALYIMKLPFEDRRTEKFNKMFAACMYWNALVESINLAVKEGPYDTFKGSPISEGKLQFDLWKEEFKLRGPNPQRKEEDDIEIDPIEWKQKSYTLANGYVIHPTWNDVRQAGMRFGYRNSLLIAHMPTATSATTRMIPETCEAPQSNLHVRKIYDTTYGIMNIYLESDLRELNLWNDTTVDYLKVNRGSISQFNNYITSNRSQFPDVDVTQDMITTVKKIEKLYRTMWEINADWCMKLSVDRGRYIDQSSSNNVYMQNPTLDILVPFHLRTVNRGAKGVIYYLRQAGADIIKWTVNPNLINMMQSNIIKWVTKTIEVIQGDKIYLDTIEDNKIGASQDDSEKLRVSSSNITQDTIRDRRMIKKSRDIMKASKDDTIDENATCSMEEGCMSCGS